MTANLTGTSPNRLFPQTLRLLSKWRRSACPSHSLDAHWIRAWAADLTAHRKAVLAAFDT
ncbi:hypothetical protein GCM10010278_82070 [Streptomyces melanogenes]|nr:hypothetical protein GCM10010278_82070 [Streptomyces melanogenes]